MLVAENYRDSWRHIVGGGVVAVTTPDRMHRVSSGPDATFADAMDASRCRPPVVADALGYHPVTTAKLAAQAGDTWSRYAPGGHSR